MACHGVHQRNTPYLSGGKSCAIFHHKLTTSQDAELASLVSDPNAAMFYDKAIKHAVENNWLMDEG